MAAMRRAACLIKASKKAMDKPPPSARYPWLCFDRNWRISSRLNN